MSLVIFATNDSPACRRATARAADLFDGADLLVTMAVAGERMEVDDDVGTSMTVRAAADEIALTAATEVVSTACETLGPRARAVVLNGEPAAVICDLASVEGAEAIVVGSLGQRRLGKVLRGSVAADLVSQAPCSVIELGQ